MYIFLLTLSRWKVKVKVSQSVMSNLCNSWTIAFQASLFIGILQARILESVAIPFSRGAFQSRDRTFVSCGSALQVDSLPSETLGKPSSRWRRTEKKKKLCKIMLKKKKERRKGCIILCKNCFYAI